MNTDVITHMMTEQPNYGSRSSDRLYKKTNIKVRDEKLIKATRSKPPVTSGNVPREEPNLQEGRLLYRYCDEGYGLDNQFEIFTWRNGLIQTDGDFLLVTKSPC